MLNALIHAKHGKHEDGEERVSWRQTFRAIEDHVTASIFERLSYLSAPCAMRLLHGTTRRNRPKDAETLFSWRSVSLDRMEFWPCWDDPSDNRRSREPDVYCEWQVGDPVRSLHLIVEAKPGSIAQLKDQWVGELKSYHHVQELEGAEEPDIIGFLAIGGRISDPQDFMKAVRAASPEVQVAIGGWEDLARALYFELKANTLPWERRILQDMSDALRLFGYIYVPFLPTLKSMPVISEGAINRIGIRT
ncbi:hypothetical protein SAMN06297129_1224 [Pseudooceanicola antarcticus]|uniref:Uncharacterized protein n=1 Tax=Pseudooceanicola antarcticus TaxID=1247613 RepID=A0A285II85_9RHOB|nr:hypothetical protein [Pseudooceanicola antarcticus]PJE28919.1 hypothetical protein CVM39_10710 [Pseudooceanicola antarcticus]SNY47695.1 hypothetical protein SAMN06297129_1224 [Pseudooceanicola antarcticus]